MGDYRAGGLFVFCLLYLILAYAVTASVTAYNTENINVSGNESVQDSLSLSGGSCQGPRERGDVFSSFDSLKCTSTPVEDENVCNEINGCSWSNATTTLLFFETAASCRGTINATAYDSTAQVNSDTLTSPGFCELSGYDNDRATCERVGCQWVDAQNIEVTPTSGFSTVTSTIGVLSGFRADIIGLPPLVSFLYSMFTFYIPLVLLIISIYYMIPVIH